MKLATMGLATALALTSTFALAQSGGTSTGGGSAATGTRIFRRRNDNREFDGRGKQRHVNRRRQRRGRAGQRAESVRHHQHQPLAQRLDPDAGADRPIAKKPRSAGLFLSPSHAIGGSISSLPAACWYFSTSRVTN